MQATGGRARSGPCAFSRRAAGASAVPPPPKPVCRASVVPAQPPYRPPKLDRRKLLEGAPGQLQLSRRPSGRRTCLRARLFSAALRLRREEPQNRFRRPGESPALDSEGSTRTGQRGRVHQRCRGIARTGTNVRTPGDYIPTRYVEDRLRCKRRVQHTHLHAVGVRRQRRLLWQWRLWLRLKN